VFLSAAFGILFDQDRRKAQVGGSASGSRVDGEVATSQEATERAERDSDANREKATMKERRKQVTNNLKNQDG
jgi:hypothetical protein